MVESEMQVFCILTYKIYKMLLLETCDTFLWSFRIYSWCH